MSSNNYLDDVDKAFDTYRTIGNSVRRRIEKDMRKKDQSPEEKKEIPPEAKKDGCGSAKKKDADPCPKCGKDPCVCTAEEKKDGCASKKDEFPPTKEMTPEEKKKEEEKKKAAAAETKKDSFEIPKAIQDQVPKDVFEGFAHFNDGLLLLKKNLMDATSQDLITKAITIRDELANTLGKSLEKQK